MGTNTLNGGNRVIGTIATELVARGHDIRVVVPPRRTLSFQRKAKTLLRKGRMPHVPPMSPFLDAIADRVTMLETRRPVTDADVPDADVVIATWWKTAAWVNALSAEKGAKLYFMQDYGASSQTFEDLAPTWEMPFSFVTLTNRLKAKINEYNPSADVAVMRNAVDHTLFNAPPRDRGTPPKIGLLFRVQHSKGMDIAARALTEIRSQIPDLRAVSVGVDHFKELDWVEQVTRPSDLEFAKIYRDCDLWLFPSRMEGFGLPIIEAMASRTPVISTRVGGAEDVITDGVSGVLVDIDNWEAMAARAVELLSGPAETWSTMSENAYQAVANYTWQDAIDVFEEALLRAARQNPDRAVNAL